MPQSAKTVASWMEAHPQIKIPEDALSTAGPWPSLTINDFLSYARGRDDYPIAVVKLVEELAHELRWAYDGWAKAADTDAQKLIIDLIHNATGDERYNFTRQFLQEYARNHGYFAEVKEEAPLPPWLQGSEGGSVVPPTAMSPVEAQSTTLAAEPPAEKRGRKSSA